MRFIIFIFLLGVSGIFLVLFGPVIKEELGYQFDQWSGVRYSLEANPQFPESAIRPINPINKEFSLVIPKLNVNVAVFPEIDPNNPSQVLPILKKGIAHVKGTDYPDEEGNVYLVAHSADTFYNVARYNAVFFLVDKLEKGDEIDLFYRSKRYKYAVIDKVILKSTETEQYLQAITGEKTLTLQIGYPPGTIFRRLIVVAQLKER